MAKDRIEPCKYYICAGECRKGRKAEHKGYCQKCGKYVPRTKVRHINRKKQKLREIREKEGFLRFLFSQNQRIWQDMI